MIYKGKIEKTWTRYDGTKTTIIIFRFSNGKKDYIVEALTSSNGRVSYSPFVRFSRFTSNVWGNCSTDVHQSGWRSLSAGAKRTELCQLAELEHLRNKIAAVKRAIGE